MCRKAPLDAYNPGMSARACVAVLFSLAAAAAFADHINTHARWHGWRIETGEELWQKRRHTGYPIPQMFDKDPKTAWVSSGGFYDEMAISEGKPRVLAPLRERYWITLTPDKAARIDEIRLMNGYNKDSATFGRNARITKVDVFGSTGDGVQKIGAFKLADAMGWRSIRLPAKRYVELRIEVTAIRRGTDPDIAISELRLLDRGKDVGPGKVRQFIFNPGDECGCGGADRLVDRKGTVLAANDPEQEAMLESPRGRYFAGTNFSGTSRRVTIWVYDAVARRKVWSRNYVEYGPTFDFDRRGRLRKVEFGDKRGERWLAGTLWSPPRLSSARTSGTRPSRSVHPA